MSFTTLQYIYPAKAHARSWGFCSEQVSPPQQQPPVVVVAMRGAVRTCVVNLVRLKALVHCERTLLVAPQPRGVAAQTQP